MNKFQSLPVVGGPGEVTLPAADAGILACDCEAKQEIQSRIKIHFHKHISNFILLQ